jgi:membrane protein insertase Oxa1/YidC/SpoIIIJ
VVFDVDVKSQALSQLHHYIALVLLLKQSGDFGYLVTSSNEAHQIEFLGAAQVVAPVALIAFKYLNSHFRISCLNVACV